MAYEKFVLGNQPPVYEPDEFAELCCQAGAPNIFNHILQAITEDRTVSIIYTIGYCGRWH